MELHRRLPRPSRPKTKTSFRPLAAAVLDPKRRPKWLLRLDPFLHPQDVLLALLTRPTDRPFVPKRQAPSPAVLLPPLLRSFVLQLSYVGLSSHFGFYGKLA